MLIIDRLQVERAIETVVIMAGPDLDHGPTADRRIDDLARRIGKALHHWACDSGEWPARRPWAFKMERERRRERDTRPVLDLKSRHIIGGKDA
jgi:hypothetical protein